VAYRKRGYLYRSRRNGRKVQTEYLGQDEAAELIAQMDAIERQEREAKRLAWKRERGRIEAADSTLAELGRLARMLTGATLIANGYHAHKRQWRRRHGKRNQDNG
jgi:hypothetical protein